MIVTKYEITIFPQTNQGRRMAYELVDNLKAHNTFNMIKEDSHSIRIQSSFRFEIQDEE